GLARDLVGAGPLEAGLAGADAVAPGLAAFLDKIEEVLARIDHDRARRVRAIVVDDLWQELRIDLPRLWDVARRARQRGGPHLVRLALAGKDIRLGSGAGAHYRIGCNAGAQRRCRLWLAARLRLVTLRGPLQLDDPWRRKIWTDEQRRRLPVAVACGCL